MRAAAFTGNGSVTLKTHPDPVAARDLVVVKILIAPLCSEARKRRDGLVSDDVGHEGAGVVVDAGPLARVSVGDRVVVMPLVGCGRCFLCMSGDYVHCTVGRDLEAETGLSTGMVAEYVIKPDSLLVTVPDDITLEHAVMACCGFGPSFTAHRRIGTTVTDTIVVSGCGPVGLGAVLQGAMRGADVIGLETVPYRADLARSLGAMEVLDPTDASTPSRVKELTAGRGADAAIESSGARTAVPLLTDTLRPRGRLAIVAWSDEIVIPSPIRLGLSVFACWHWNTSRYVHEMWTSIRKAGPLIDVFVTHRFDLEEVSLALDTLDTFQCGKVFVLPSGAAELEAAR